MAKRVVFGLLGASLLLGMQFSSQGSDSEEVKAHLVSVCAADSRCVQTVEAAFEACFESSDRLAGRRQASRLEADQLVQCLNSKSGRSHFASAE